MRVSSAGFVEDPDVEVDVEEVETGEGEGGCGREGLVILDGVLKEGGRRVGVTGAGSSRC